jgi:acyl-CoA thioester hydrolase
MAPSAACNENCTVSVPGRMGRPYVHTLRVRYGECDPQGVVFNAHYLAYFDVALTEMWRAAVAGGYGEMMQRGVDLMVAETTCRYRVPARFDDELSVALGITHLGTTSMRTRFDVTRGGATVVEGDMRHVFIDLATHRKTPVPDWLRAALAPWAA